MKPDECEKYMNEPPISFNWQSLNRIQGSMIGLILGDALGAHVEFRSHSYLVDNPVTDLRGGGTWGLQKGQVNFTEKFCGCQVFVSRCSESSCN